VSVFEAGDHVTVRTGEEGAHEDEASPEADAEHDDEGHDHAAGDPHLWLDPIAMRDVAAALVPALGEVCIDVEGRGTTVAAALEAVDEEARSILEAVPADRRKLVTGHESLGYFADRYGFELVGAVVPGLSTQGEASARELAALADAIRAAGVSVVFSERGTPPAVAAAVAEETGAAVVELPVEQLPDDGSYLSFIRSLATTVANGLAG
jgi:zinc/manganese transport system substrate-binding protein